MTIYENIKLNKKFLVVVHSLQNRTGSADYKPKLKLIITFYIFIYLHLCNL